MIPKNEELKKILEETHNIYCEVSGYNYDMPKWEETLIKVMEILKIILNTPEDVKNPCGLHQTDTLEDCFKRADRLATPKHHSGKLCKNKDLRRIVLLVYEYRRLKEKDNTKLASPEETIANYEKAKHSADNSTLVFNSKEQAQEITVENICEEIEAESLRQQFSRGLSIKDTTRIATVIRKLIINKKEI